MADDSVMETTDMTPLVLDICNASPDLSIREAVKIATALTLAGYGKAPF
jgi:hypothetical protein